MQNLTTHDEDKLLAATKAAGDLVESGVHPDAAVEKVARENKFGPGEIRLLAYAHNTGRQVGQFQKSANILDKLAEFPLADPDKVIAAIYPNRATEKAAADGLVSLPTAREVTGRHIDYLMPPTWADRHTSSGLEKAALDLPPLPKPAATPTDPMDAARRQYGNMERLKLAYETARQDAFRMEQELYRHVAAVTSYFQSPGRLPFATVEKVARTLHGEPAVTLLTAVHQRLKTKEKRAAETPDRVEPYTIRTDMPVFGHISACIDAGRLLSEKRASLAEKEAAFLKAKESTTGPFAAGRPGTAPDRPTSVEKQAMGLLGWGTEVGAIAAGDIIAHKATHSEDEDLDRQAKAMFADTDDEIRGIRGQTAAAMRKQAIFNSPAMGAFLGNSVGRIVGDGPKSKNELIEDEWLDLEDPKHQNELRKIKAHSMLNSMLTDPDSPIAGQDPDDVIAHYNEISQLAPRVAEQPAAVRPILARKLQGNVQPFEAKEITDIEKGISATRNSTPNTSLLKDAPDSLLG